VFYEEISPSSFLAGAIKCFWSLASDVPAVQAHSETVLPDGNLEIIFNFADRFRRFHHDGTVDLQPRAIVVGQMRQFVQIQPTGRVDLFGIRFHTSGAYRAFRCPLADLTDRIFELDVVFGPLARALEDELYEARSTRERARVIETKLATHLKLENDREPVVEAVKRHITERHGVVGVRETAKDFGVSQRQLERHFREMVGVSPKAYSRIIRLQSFILAYHRDTARNLLDLALRFGYYDQSHFIRDFTAFAGRSPTAFLRAENKMADAFIGL
jgi:AraC-like DNA-binding protein